MTNISYHIAKVIHSKAFYLLTLCLFLLTSAVTFISTPALHKCEMATDIYPVVMSSNKKFEKIVWMGDGRLLKVLKSRIFREYMVEASGGLLTPSNYDKKIKVTRNADYVCTIHLYDNDTTAGINLLKKGLACFRNIYSNYPTTLMEQNLMMWEWDPFEEMYKKKRVSVCDVVNPPCVKSVPSAKKWGLTVFLSLVFATFSAAASVLVWNGLKHSV